MVAFSVGEEELSQVGLDTKPLLGHLAAWNYFEERRQSRTTRSSSTSGTGFHEEPGSCTTNDPMEAHYIGSSKHVLVKGV